MYVLWLASWFPDKKSPYNGDFIARHAVAASLYNNITVLHAVKDDQANTVRIERTHLSPTCKSITIYYPKVSSFGAFEKLASAFLFVVLQMKEIRKLFLSDGRPRLVHLHIVRNAGVIALCLKAIYGIPYIVSEQATHYLKEDENNYFNAHFITRILIKKVLDKAHAVTAVSKTLANALKLFCAGVEARVVPNVVDRNVFYYTASDSRREAFTLIHVSNFFPQKNTRHILEAFKILQENAPGKFALTMAGAYPPELSEQERWERIGVHFIGEMNQDKLAAHLRESDALILYSLYETFGCVLIEAMACGLPVIVADIPVFHETVRENVNGIFVHPENPFQLAEKIKEIRKNYPHFEKPVMSQQALNVYSFERVGQMFADIYKI
jgi:glycosyltransferase involved in cell wall biosynthesis